jgi:hypothetical protein
MPVLSKKIKKKRKYLCSMPFQKKQGKEGRKGRRLQSMIENSNR